MKTPSDFLWRLIKSLSKAEKLFFTRNFNASHPIQETLYLKLFNAISTQKEYDETVIKKMEEFREMNQGQGGRGGFRMGR